MMPEVTVISVLRTGQYRGRAYTADWVHRLKAMVARHLRPPYRFVCFTDIDIPGIDCLRLVSDLPGWWAKLEVFRWNADGRCLYLDLDTLITGELNSIVNFPAEIAFTPPHHVLMGTPLKKAPGVKPCYQTSCMVWTPPVGHRIYYDFRHHMLARYRSDQDWIATVNPDWPLMPKEWFCKLRQCENGPAAEVKVVLGDGKWKNDTAPWPWVKELWCGNLLGAESSVAHA